MDWDAIQKKAEVLMRTRKEHRERERGFIYYHGQRVANGAIALRKLVVPEDDSMDDLLRIAGWFHDIGKGLPPHAHYGASLLPAVLDGLVPSDMLAQAADMILHHPSRQAGESPYDLPTQILQDADLIDHYGCYGIWMAAQYASYFDSCLATEVVNHDNDAEDGFCKNVEELNFSISKKILRDRIDFENRFFERARLEAQGLYPGY